MVGWIILLPQRIHVLILTTYECYLTQTQKRLFPLSVAGTSTSQSNEALTARLPETPYEVILKMPTNTFLTIFKLLLFLYDKLWNRKEECVLKLKGKINIVNIDSQTFYLWIAHKSINCHAKYVLDLSLCQVSQIKHQSAYIVFPKIQFIWERNPFLLFPSENGSWLT